MNMFNTFDNDRGLNPYEIAEIRQVRINLLEKEISQVKEERDKLRRLISKTKNELHSDLVLEVNHEKREAVEWQRRAEKSQRELAECQAQLNLLKLEYKKLDPRTKSIFEEEKRLWQSQFERADKALSLEQVRLARMEGELEERERKLTSEIDKVKKDCEKKLAVERKSAEKDKKRYANEKVAEALGRQRKEYEDKINELLDKNNDRSEPAQQQLPKPSIQDKAEKNWQLDTKARLFVGEDKEARFEELRCSICLVNEVCVVYKPCMHVATCIDCSPRQFFAFSKCQLCKKTITDFESVII